MVASENIQAIQKSDQKGVEANPRFATILDVLLKKLVVFPQTTTDCFCDLPLE